MANPPSTVNENESSVRDQGDRTKGLSQEENEVEVKMPEGRTVLDNEKNGVNVMKCEQKSVKDSKKNSMTGDEEALAVMVTVPPDGGWGWVVVAASFVANFIVDGILYCYGDFLPVIKNDFHETSAKVSIPGSLLAGFYLMTGTKGDGDFISLTPDSIESSVIRLKKLKREKSL